MAIPWAFSFFLELVSINEHAQGETMKGNSNGKHLVMTIVIGLGVTIISKWFALGPVGLLILLILAVVAYAAY